MSYPWKKALPTKAYLAIIFSFLAACSSENRNANDSPSPSQSAKSDTAQATTIIHGGTIYTARDERPTVEAIALHDDKIIAIGSLDTMLALGNEQTTKINLDGNALFPGFTDAHGHLIGIGMRELTLNLENIESIAALTAAIRQEASTIPVGETIYGRGWIETDWPEERFPNRQDLDSVAPDHPVILIRADGHALVANSLALSRSNITADTADPSGGRIEKDDNGTPTGILVDAAQALVNGLIDTPSKERVIQAYEVGSKVYAAYGWTSIHNMSVPASHVPIMGELAGTYTERNISRLPIRVYNSLNREDLGWLVQNGHQVDQSGRIITRAIKMYADGALGSRGAALFDAYTDQPETKGLVLLENQTAIDAYKLALKNNIQVNTHAIGDRGNRLVLDWYKSAYDDLALPQNDIASPRHRIEHTQIVRLQDIPDIKAYGLIPSMQPSHAIGDLHFAPDRLGDDRLNGAYAWRSIIDAGIIIAAGSDAPVERGDPRIEFYAAISRKDQKGFQGNNWHPEEAVSRAEALKMFTIWPAIASFQEDDLGTIAVGKKADFTVFSSDIMTIPAAEILNIETVMTIIDGKIIYQR